MRELQALAAPNPPQGVLVCGHAGLVINTLSLETELDVLRPAGENVLHLEIPQFPPSEHRVQNV